MKYLDDNESVTQEELLDSCRAAVDAAHDAAAAHDSAAAYVAAYTYATADDYAYAAAIASAVATAAYAAYANAATTAADAHYAKNTIDRYFNFAGENKQDYIDEITTNN